ncbi:hypothetical protein C1646_678358, partial [Rhizophagus diaphanus]
MGYTDGDIISKDFMEKFQMNKEKSGEEIKKILDEYLRKFNDDDEEINEENIEEIVQKLLKERDEVQGIYRKLKIELDPDKKDDKEVKEKLRDYILELEKDGYNTDNSEKIGEILSPEEYEEWDENIENIGEDEIENNINMRDFGS